MQRVADRVRDLRLGRIGGRAEHGDRIQIHGRLALQEGVHHLAEVEGSAAGWPGVDNLLEHLCRLDGGGLVDHRHVFVVDDEAVIGRQVQQPTRRYLMARLRARRHAAHTRLLGLDGARRRQHLVIGRRHFDVVLGKDVLAVGKDGTFRAIGQAVEFRPRSRQITARAADQAEAFIISLDDIAPIIVGHRQFSVLEHRLKFGQELALHIFRLPHDHVDADVVFALRLAHLQHLRVLQAQIRHLVELDFDAGGGGEVGQQLLGDGVMRVRRPVHDNRLPLQLGPAGALRTGVIGQRQRCHCGSRSGGLQRIATCGGHEPDPLERQRQRPDAVGCGFPRTSG